MSAGSNDTSSPAPISSRAALRNAGMGEIVQVQGGHIVRSTGRKDRHSKVCTAKGPRDRRVRLSAHTAIQFYDVQDRLGYDRPSKAVDWLIKKAKTAIDQLEELPAWKPTTATMVNVRQQRRGKNVAAANEDDEGAGAAAATNMEVATGESSRSSLALTDGQRRRGVGEMYDNAADGSGGGLLPPSMDSDSIADTIKSFFPVGGSGASATQVTAGEVTDAMRSVVSSSGGVHSMQFQTYPPPQHDLLSRRHFNNGQTTQDLKLSLQSFQDPVGFQTHHHHRHQNPHQHDHNQEDTQQQQQQSLFEFSNPSTGWGSDSQQQQAAELGRYQRQLIGWNFGNVDSDCTRGSGGGGGFVFVPPQQAQQQPLLQQLFGHGIGVGGGSVVHHGIGPNNSSVHNAAATATSQLYSQRGPLQSSNTPSIRAWMGENFIDKDGNQHKDDHRQAAAGAFIHPVSLSGIGFTSSGGFSGFHIPARIQGGDEEQQHDGNNPNMSSSASPGSHH